jgi:hypothetical protein
VATSQDRVDSLVLSDMMAETGHGLSRASRHVVMRNKCDIVATMTNVSAARGTEPDRVAQVDDFREFSRHSAAPLQGGPKWQHEQLPRALELAWLWTRRVFPGLMM